jgi:phage tail-like protein
MSTPYLGYWFAVTGVSATQIGFAEATLSDISIAKTSYREGTDDLSMRTLSGLVSYGEVTLNKGLTPALDLYNWIQTVLQKGSGPATRKNITISLIDASQSPVASWNLNNALPIRHAISGFNAANTEVVLETLVLDIGSIERKL